MLQKLGFEGMSSDDTDNRDLTQRVYRVRVLDWQRNVDRELHVIDRMRLEGEEVWASQGSKPAPRIRGEGNPSRRRDPPTGLPESFYNATWLINKDKSWRERVLCVSKEEFHWLKINCNEEER